VSARKSLIALPILALAIAAPVWAASSRSEAPTANTLQARVTRLERVVALLNARLSNQQSEIQDQQGRHPHITVTTSSGIPSSVLGGFQYTTLRSTPCGGGESVVGGFYSADHAVTPVMSSPDGSGAWQVAFWNSLSVVAQASVGAICATVSG
jgi:hypothetical protein